MNQIIVCDCGNPEAFHNFRHPFNGIVTVERYTDDNDKEFFVIDALDFKAQKVLAGDKCQVPQCNAGKLLHGPVIQHPYIPSDMYEKRVIRFTLPLNTLCRTCNITLEEHNSLTHIFHSLILIKNRGIHDEVIIRGKNEDQKIKWEN